MPTETESTLTPVLLEVPLAPETQGFIAHRTGAIRLTPGAGKTLKRLYEAVSGRASDSKPLTISDGTPVNSLESTLCWLLERIEKSE